MSKTTSCSCSPEAVYIYGFIGYLLTVWGWNVNFSNKLFGAIIWPFYLGAFVAHNAWPELG